MRSVLRPSVHDVPVKLKAPLAHRLGLLKRPQLGPYSCGCRVRPGYGRRYLALHLIIA